MLNNDNVNDFIIDITHMVPYTIVICLGVYLYTYKIAITTSYTQTQM